jgi:hypothetical protein
VFIRICAGAWLTRFTVGLKLVFGAEERRVRIDERGPVALEQVGRGQLAVVLGEFRLPVEEFKVARGARLKHVDHPLRLRGVVRLLHGQGRRVGDARGRFPRGEGPGGDAGQPDAALPEKPAASEQTTAGVAHRIVCGHVNPPSSFGPLP